MEAEEPSLHLLGLPVELREHIYSYFVHPAETRVQRGRMAGNKYDLRFFLVNRQVYHEARDLLRRLNVFVRIETPWHEAKSHIVDEGKVPIVAFGKPAIACKYARMIVNISAHELGFQHAMHNMLLLAQDLPAFATFWFYSDLSHPGLNSNLRLVLTLRNPFSTDPASPEPLPRSLQRRLLLPFGKIKNLDRTTIEGPVDPTVASALTAAQNIAHKTPGECCDEATRLLTEGTAHLNAGRYEEAKQLFKQAFLAIHIVCSGRERLIWANAYFETIVPSGPRAGTYWQLVRLILRVQLVAAMCSLLLKQQNWAEAEFWGMRSIELMRQSMGVSGDDDEPVRGFVAEKDMGLIYFRTAFAYRKLGEMEMSEKLLKVAEGYLVDHKDAMAAERAALKL